MVPGVETRRQDVQARLVLVTFFLSGAAALIYEISWSRLIGVYFGYTVHAAAIILCAFFAGMAVGYHLATHLLPRVDRPLRAYAVAELVVAAWAIAMPSLTDGLLDAEWLIIDASGNLARVTATTLTALFIMLPATVALGTTLPSVAAYFSSGDIGANRRLALAYGVNTAGAVAGTALATFVLILHFGVRGSGYVAAGLSAFCGFTALALSTTGPKRIDTRSAVARRLPIAPIWYLAAAVSGFSTLGLEVLYTRLLGLSFQNSTYTFGAVLGVFLLALSAGAFVARFSASESGRSWLGWASLSAACATLGSVVAFTQITHFEPVRSTNGFGGYVLSVCGLVAVTVGPPVVCVGLMLPLTWSAAGGHPRMSVSRLTTVSTIAGAAASIVTAFVLLQWLDLWLSFTLFAALHLVLTCVLFGSDWTRLRVVALVVASVAVAGFAWLVPRAMPGALADGTVVVQRTTSPYGWTDVVRHAASGELSLRQNLHDHLGSTAYLRSHQRQADLPLLLHPDPKRVLFLGLGTGISAGAATRYAGIESIDIVELVGSVVTAAKHFAAANNDIVDDPKARIVVDDARHFVGRHERRYDVIVADLFVPWHSHTGYLFTVEHYQAVRRSLLPGGLFCQWLFPAELGAPELEMIADSLASAFPYVTVWRGDLRRGVPLLALIASETPLVIDRTRLERELATRRPSDAGAELDEPERMPDLYLGGWRVKNRDRLNTTDHPRVEFLAPVTDVEFSVLIGRRLQEFHHDVLMKLPRDGPEIVMRNGLASDR